MEPAARVLAGLDWGVIAIYGVISIILGLWYTKKASKSVNEYFISGRSMPWFLIGAWSLPGRTQFSTGFPERRKFPILF